MNLVFKRILPGLLLFCILSCSNKKTENTHFSSAPNLIIILADDLGYGDVGFNGCEDIPTPNIDRLARQGVIFKNGYVSYPVCGPSRAGLLTGRYQDRFGFGRNPLFAPNDPDQGLPTSEMTLADALHQVDYKNVAIGKWHLGAHPSQRPLQRGFDDFFGFLTGGHKYFPEQWTLADEYEVTSQFEAYNTKLLRNTTRIEETEYLTDALSREAVSYIEKYQEDPFFIYLAYNAPHSPLQATEKYLDRFDHINNKKRKTYAAMVSSIDDGVGKVLNKLEELEIEENTIVVFLSDNGGPENRNASDNGPLRGQKGNLTEGGIHVPFVMSWPGTIPSGIEYEHPVISLDIFGTMAGIHMDKIQFKNPIDGVNLLPFVTGKSLSPAHDQLFWRKFDQQRSAIRMGREKIISYPDSTLFFDLDEDLSEQNNLWEPGSPGVDRLEKIQSAWSEELMDPIFLGLNQNNLYDEQHPNRFKRPVDDQ